MTKREFALAGWIGVALLAAACASYKAPPLFDSKRVNFPPATNADPVKAVGVPASVSTGAIRSLRVVAPAAPTDFSSVRIYEDVHALERDVRVAQRQSAEQAALNTVAPRGEFESRAAYQARVNASRNGTAPMALTQVLYVARDAEFLYNIDTEQFLVLPARTSVVPVSAVATVAPPAPDEAVGLLVIANTLYNQRSAAAAEVYTKFLQDFPNHTLADKARQGLALIHFQRGQFAQAAPLLEALVKKENPDKLLLETLLLQCQQVLKEGKQVKSVLLNDFRMEPSKPTESVPAPRPNECDPPPPPKPTLVPAPAGEATPKAPASPAATTTEVGVFPPGDAPPDELTLAYWANADAKFFESGLLVDLKAREEWLKSHMHPGQPGLILPSKADAKVAQTIKPRLRVVAGYRLIRTLPAGETGRVLEYCQIASFHVIDGTTKKVYFECGLK